MCHADVGCISSCACVVTESKGMWSRSVPWQGDCLPVHGRDCRGQAACSNMLELDCNLHLTNQLQSTTTIFVSREGWLWGWALCMSKITATVQPAGSASGCRGGASQCAVGPYVQLLTCIHARPVDAQWDWNCPFLPASRHTTPDCMFVMSAIGN